MSSLHTYLPSQTILLVLPQWSLLLLYVCHPATDTSLKQFKTFHHSVAVQLPNNSFCLPLVLQLRIARLEHVSVQSYCLNLTVLVLFVFLSVLLSLLQSVYIFYSLLWSIFFLFYFFTFNLSFCFAFLFWGVGVCWGFFPLFLSFLNHCVSVSRFSPFFFMLCSPYKSRWDGLAGMSMSSWALDLNSWLKLSVMCMWDVLSWDLCLLKQSETCGRFLTSLVCFLWHRCSVFHMTLVCDSSDTGSVYFLWHFHGLLVCECLRWLTSWHWKIDTMKVFLDNTSDDEFDE